MNRDAMAWIQGAAWGSVPMVTSVRMAARLVEREAAELAIRTVVVAEDLDGWLRLAEETGAWQSCYEAACLGLSLEEWEPAARAGYAFTVALEAIRACVNDEAARRLAVTRIREFTEGT